jgi:ankyrin repeat protein
LDPYNVALKYGKIKSFSELLGQSDDFQEYSETFGSVLLLAIQSGNPKVVDLIIKRGVDINRVDRRGDGALHYIFKNLKEPNIDVYHFMTETLLNMKLKMNNINKEGETALIQCIKSKIQYPFLLAEAWNNSSAPQGLNESHFSKFRNEKFDFDIPDQKTGKTCLHYAAESNFLGLNNLITH